MANSLDELAAVWDLEPMAASSTSFLSRSAPPSTSLAGFAELFEQSRSHQPSQLSSSSSRNDRPPSESVCEHCGCSTVPLWRVSSDGLITCSGCGRSPRAPYDTVRPRAGNGSNTFTRPTAMKRSKSSCKGSEGESSGGFTSGVSLGSSSASKGKRRESLSNKSSSSSFGSSSNSNMDPPSSTSRPSSSSSRNSHASSTSSNNYPQPNNNQHRVLFPVPESAIDLTDPSPPATHPPPFNDLFLNSNIPPELLMLAFPDAASSVPTRLQNASTAAFQRRAIDQASGRAPSFHPPPTTDPSSPDLLAAWMRDLASPAPSASSGGSSGSVSTPASSISSNSTFNVGTPAATPNTTLDFLTSMLNASGSSTGGPTGIFPPPTANNGSPSRMSVSPQPVSQQPHRPAPPPPLPPMNSDTIRALLEALQSQVAASSPQQPRPPPQLHPNVLAQTSSFPEFSQPPPPLPPPPARPKSASSSGSRSRGVGAVQDVQAEMNRLRQRVVELEFLNRIVQMRNVELETEKAASRGWSGQQQQQRGQGRGAEGWG